MKSSYPIPVLMYHTVGKKIPDWAWSFLTVPCAVFEDHLRWLKRTRYNTVDLGQLYAHVSGKKVLKGKNVVLTFDDGYLDNWAFVAPLLKKYGFKATVYVNPEFVDTRDITRPTLEDVWRGACAVEDLEVRGFMSWQELRKIEESKVFSVQSHLMTHTWYPVSDEIVDFHHPGDEYYWLEWNEFPESKPYYLQSVAARRIPLGVPVYKNAKSMAAVRCYPDTREKDYIVDYVKNNGAEAFFNEKDWKRRLNDQVRLFREKTTIATAFETSEECRKRINRELNESKKILEEKLNKKVEFMAWPGGGYTEEIFAIGLQTYTSITLGSWDRSDHFNRVNDDAKKIKRMGVPYIEKGGYIDYPGGSYLIFSLCEYSGAMWAKYLRKAIKALSLFDAYLSTLLKSKTRK